MNSAQVVVLLRLPGINHVNRLYRTRSIYIVIDFPNPWAPDREKQIESFEELPYVAWSGDTELTRWAAERCEL